MVQSSCSVKNGKLNETIEASALWSKIARNAMVEIYRLRCDV